MDVIGTIETVMGFMKPDDLAELIALSVKDKEEKFIELFVKSISRMECYKNNIQIANSGYIEQQFKAKIDYVVRDLKEKEVNP